MPTVATMNFWLGFVHKRTITSPPCKEELFFQGDRKTFNSKKLTSARKKSTNADVRSTLQHARKCYVSRPTWSVEDLGLASCHPPVNQNELKRLARLALIDIAEKSDPLEQDLGNMFHMIQRLTDYQQHHLANKSSAIGINLESASCDTVVYDTVRGVRGMWLRKGIEEDLLQAEDSMQAREVRNSFLQRNIIRRGGGHVYFAIET